MTARLALFALCFVLGSCGSVAPEAASPPQYTIEQFLDTTSLSGGALSHDDAEVVYSSDETGIFNLHAVSASGGEPTQLTTSTTDSLFALSYFPNDKRILYTADQGGNEIYHIYLRDEDGATRDLTPADGARALFQGWAADDQGFYFQSNERDPKAMDLYRMPIDTFEPELLFQNDGGYSVGSVSDDGGSVALIKTITRDNSDTYLYDVMSRQVTHLTPHEGNINYSPAFFSPDGAELYLLTDKDSEFRYLAKMDLATQEIAPVKDAEWDVMFASRSDNGNYLVVGVNEDARTAIEVYNFDDMTPVALPELPAGEITTASVSDSEKKLLFYHSGDRTPPDLYLYDFEAKKHAKLTDTSNPEIDSEHLSDARVVRFKSFDGLEIPAILMEPKLAAGQKAPALVDVHGGPGGQSRLGYSALYQYLVNHGYAVLRVNNRGSSGYGKSFYAMDDLRHGDVDLKDCIWGKRYLQTLDSVDPERIGIMGGSYGGYMTLAALAFAPDEFNVGVDIFGVANWVRTLESIPPWWEAQRDSLFAELGNPETDAERLKAISPLFHAEKIRKPLIVLQGANDPRVLQVESDEIVEAVRANGVPVEYVVFDDEGHGFTKKDNRIEGYEAILVFLDAHLKGGS